MFESSVNSEGIETFMRYKLSDSLFESSVNSEGIETERKASITWSRLRAV